MNRLIIAGLLGVGATLMVLAQSTNIPPDIDKSGRTITPRPQPHLIYSPADLAHNAITLPASGTTSTSGVVNMSAVTKSTLFVNCTQIVNVQVNTYKEDGITIDGTYALVTNLPVGPQQIYIASELAPNTTGGTLSVGVRRSAARGRSLAARRRAAQESRREARTALVHPDVGDACRRL